MAFHRQLIASRRGQASELQKCRERLSCRLCGSDALEHIVSLASTPPANAFTKSKQDSLAQQRYPLRPSLCRACGHLQLVDIVDRELLFADYVYVSGTSPSFITHFNRYAEAVSQRLDLSPGDLVVDIGSNDGTLLKAFKDRGCRVLGVDPAKEIATKANSDGIETLVAYFDTQLAREILNGYGPAKVITANNVFAHVDDISDLTCGVRSLLGKDGSFVFEVSYLVDILQKTLFDTIYHEHLDYHRVAPLRQFFHQLGMTLFDVERIGTHGGSLRGYAGLGDKVATENVDILTRLEESLELSSPNGFVEFKRNIARCRTELTSLLAALRLEEYSIVGYGAPAKATTLLHQFELGSSVITGIVDDSPLKQGLFTPGTGIPVHPADWLMAEKPHYLLILAWNFANSIIKKNEVYAASGGRFITPLPNLSVRTA